MSYVHIPPKVYQKAEKWLLATFARHVLATTPTPKWKNPGHKNPHLENSWFENSIIRKECWELIKNLEDHSPKWTKPKAFKTSSKSELSVDLYGWKYLEEISPPSRWKAPKSIKLTLLFQNRKKTGATYFPGWFPEIQINAFNAYHKNTDKFFSLSYFHDHLELLRKRLRHELQHFAQDLLSTILYSLKRDPIWGAGNPREGIVLSNFRSKSCGSSSYYLQGQEFYPNLEDVLCDIEKTLSKMQPKKRRYVFKCILGLSKGDWNTRLFEVLLKYDRIRWRKAVKEAYLRCGHLL